MSLIPNSPWAGIIKFFSARESSVSDIPAGDGKTTKLCYSVYFPVLPGISPPPPIPTPAGDEFARKMTLLLQRSGDDTGGRKEGEGRKEGGGGY
jgi:hypothetical protein